MTRPPSSPKSPVALAAARAVARVAACGALVLAVACGGARAGPRQTVASSDASTGDASAGDASSVAAAGSAFRDLVMTADDCRTPPHDAVSRADALADIAVVERIVRRGWAGFETMTAAGVDFDALFADLTHSIATAPQPMAIADFQDRLVRALHPAADNHMAFLFFTKTGHAHRKPVGTSLRAYTADVAAEVGDGAQLVACDGHETRDLLRPTLVLSTSSGARSAALAVAPRPIVMAETQPAPLRCHVRLGDGSLRDISVPLHRVRVGNPRARSSPAFELVDGAIPRLALRSFWSGRDAELTAFVSSAAALRDKQAIIVDVRRNGGGSDGYAKDWLAQLTDQTIVGANVDRLDSDVTRQGIVNDNTCQIAEGLDDAAALRDANERLAYGRRVVGEAESAGVPLRMWRPRNVVSQGHAPKRFRAPLVVLVDNGCASACESFVSYARQLDGAVVIGENSGGVGVFGEVLVYRLPRSGLGMTAGMKYFHHPDPARAVVEGRGHLPDYWVDAEDPSALVERIAECLAKPSCPLLARQP